MAEQMQMLVDLGDASVTPDVYSKLLAPIHEVTPWDSVSQPGAARPCSVHSDSFPHNPAKARSKLSDSMASGSLSAGAQRFRRTPTPAPSKLEDTSTLSGSSGEGAAGPHLSSFSGLLGKG